MATIGTFSKKDETWTGTIRTMTINLKASLIPVKHKRSSDAREIADAPKNHSFIPPD